MSELRSQQSDLVAWTASFRNEDGLRGLTPALTMVAGRIESSLDNPALVTEAAYWPAVDEIPYSCAALPPDLTEVYADPDSPPTIPDTAAGVEAMMRAYWPYRLRNTGPGPQRNTPANRTDLEAHLNKMRQNGQRIDPDAWRQYRNVHQVQKDRARLGKGVCTLALNAARMCAPRVIRTAESTGVMETAKGRYDTLLLTSPNSAYYAISPARMPVGEYGAGFAERILRAACYIIDFVEQDPVSIAAIAQSAERHSDVVGRHVYRALEDDLPGVEEGAIANLQESVLSIISIIALHTATRVSRFASGDDFFSKIIQDNLIPKTTKIAPLTVAGATAIFGLYYPGANEEDSQGQLACSETLKGSFARMDSLIVPGAHHDWRQYYEQLKTDPDAIPPARTALPCPFSVAYKRAGLFMPSAIKTYADLLYKVYNTIDAVDSDHEHGLPWNGPQVVENANRLPVGSFIQELGSAGILKIVGFEGINLLRRAKRPPDLKYYN